MERLAELQRRITTLRELGEVFAALRMLSVSRLQQAQAASEGISEYAAAVGRAIGAALALVPDDGGEPQPGPRIRIVFGAEHGFCGALNERLLDGAELGAGDTVWVVGRRLSIAAADRRIPVAHELPMATQCAGVLEVARRLSARLLRLAAEAPVEEVTLVFARGPGAAGIERARALPLDRAAFGAPGGAAPLVQLAPERLLASLIDEYVLAELTRAAMASFAAENDARLRVMQSALDNVDDRLTDSRRAEARLRQEEVTTELLDVVNGVVAARERT